MNVKEVIKEVFPKWSEGKRNQIILTAVNDQLTIASINYGKTTYVGESWRDLRDEPNERIGIYNALQDLKRTIKNARRKKEKKTWIPAMGTHYFTIETKIFPPKFDDEYAVVFKKWTGNSINYTELGMGLVFKTPRAAKKYIRAAEIKGRKAKNRFHKIP